MTGKSERGNNGQPPRRPKVYRLLNGAWDARNGTASIIHVRENDKRTRLTAEARESAREKEREREEDKKEKSASANNKQLPNYKCGERETFWIPPPSLLNKKEENKIWSTAWVRVTVPFHIRQDKKQQQRNWFNHHHNLNKDHPFVITFVDSSHHMDMLRRDSPTPTRNKISIDIANTFYPWYYFTDALAVF